MRQLVLVVVLVGAAFLGGAFVNGPGLRWVQTQVLGSLGLSEGGEIASVNLKGSATPDHGGDGIGSIKGSPEPVQGPIAPMPSIIAEVEKGKPDPSISRPVPASASDRRSAPLAVSPSSSRSPSSSLTGAKVPPSPSDLPAQSPRLERHARGRAIPRRSIKSRSERGAGPPGIFGGLDALGSAFAARGCAIAAIGSLRIADLGSRARGSGIRRRGLGCVESEDAKSGREPIHHRRPARRPGRLLLPDSPGGTPGRRPAFRGRRAGWFPGRERRPASRRPVASDAAAIVSRSSSHGKKGGRDNPWIGRKEVISRNGKNYNTRNCRDRETPVRDSGRILAESPCR